MDSALHVQNAVRASQLESTARNVRVNSFNSATPGAETLIDPLAMSAPSLFQNALKSDEADAAKTASAWPAPSDLQENRTVDSLQDHPKLARSADAGFAPTLRHRAAPGFSSQLHRVAAEMRPRAEKLPLLDNTR